MGPADCTNPNLPYGKALNEADENNEILMTRPT